MSKTGSGAHPASYPPGRCFSRGMNLPGHEADHIHPYSADVKNAWSHTSPAPIHAFTVSCVTTRNNITKTTTLSMFQDVSGPTAPPTPPPPIWYHPPSIPRLTALSSSPDTLMNEWSMSKGKVILISRGYKGFT